MACHQGNLDYTKGVDKKRFKVRHAGKPQLIFMAVFVALGTSLALYSWATHGPVTAVESESGTLSGNVTAVSDTKASAGSAVKFGVPATSTGISFSGNQIMKNGTAFYPKGFNSIGILQPDSCTHKSSVATTAANNYDVAELTAMTSTWKANTIRLQVSQKGMDPLDPDLKNGHAAYIRMNIFFFDGRKTISLWRIEDLK